MILGIAVGTKCHMRVVCAVIVLVFPDDAEGRQRLSRYMSRCPFSLEKMRYAPDSGMVIYRSKPHATMKRNYQLMPAIKWLRLLMNHIPDRYEHLARYYGYYSNRSRGARRLIENGDDTAGSIHIDEPPAITRRKAAWARLIQKVYEVDPPLPQGETRSLTYHPVPAHLKSTPGRPCGPVMLGSPRSGESATQSGRIRYQILPRRTQVHGLPALSAPSPGCSSRFPCATPQPRDRISYPSTATRSHQTGWTGSPLPQVPDIQAKLSANSRCAWKLLILVIGQIVSR
jgi:hypothetical protein